MKRRSKTPTFGIAHSSQKIGLGLAFLCACLVLLMLILEKTRPDVMQSVRNASMDIVAPITGLLSMPRDALNNVGESIDDYAQTQKENDRLRKENKTLLQWQSLAHQYARENEQMRKLLQVVPKGNKSLISAHMVSSITSSTKHVALISAGAENGVKPNLAVIAAEGLIGRIIDIGKQNARILLITDINANIPIINERSGEHAIITGHPDGAQLKLDLANKPDSFHAGDRLVTSGAGGTIPAGIPVAAITSVNGLSVLASPLADIHRSSIVTIVDYSF